MKKRISWLRLPVTKRFAPDVLALHKESVDGVEVNDITISWRRAGLPPRHRALAESAWNLRSRKPRATRSPDDMVYVRVGYGEEGLHAKLKALGALWRPHHKLWELPWGVVRGLSLEDRVIPP